MAAKNEIEVFEYLAAKANVNGLNINDLQNLLLMPGPEKSFKHLKVRTIKPDYLLIYDKQKPGNVYLGCVCEYYDMSSTDCYRIRRELGTYNDNQDNERCVKCHLKCIENKKNGLIK